MTREWRNTRRILAGLCVFAIAGGLVLWGWRQACKANYTRVREGLESKGARLSVAANLPVVDPGFANGGRIFLEHVGGIPKPPNYMGYVCMELIAPGRAMSAAGLGAIPYETESGAWTNLWDALPGHVEPGRGAWTLLRPAATHEVIAFDLAYHDNIRLLLPHLSSWRTLFEWMRLAVLLDLHEGNHLDAVDAAVDGLELIARHREPIIISQLVRASAFGIHLEAIWELLQSPSISDKDLARVQAALERVDFVHAWADTLRMDCAMGLDCFEEVIKAGSWTLASGKTSGSPLSRLLSAIRDGFLVGKWNEAGRAGMEFAWWFAPAYQDAAFYATERTRCHEDMRRVMEGRSVAAATYTDPKVPEWYLMSSGLIPSGSLQRKVFLTESSQSLALAAVALERFRRLNGHWPETLDALTPDLLAEIPVDWFDGAPLRYRRETDGRFRLWSIGPNGVDDGGSPADAGEDWLKGDDQVWPQRADPAEVKAYLGRQQAKMSGVLP